MPELEELWRKAYNPEVPRHLDYPNVTLVDIFMRASVTFAKRPAMDFFGRRTSYEQLATHVRNVAANLYELGVRPGDHVALLMPTCPQHVIAIYATMLCGATIVEHNPLYTCDELAPMFADHKAKIAIIWDAAASHVLDLPAEARPEKVITINLVDAMPISKRLLLKLPVKRVRETRAQLSTPAPGTIPFSSLLKPGTHVPFSARPKPSDAAMMLYTSGTTGTPKGVPLTHANIAASTLHSVTWVTCCDPGRDVFLVSLPLFHVFGFTLSMSAAIADGAMMHLIPKPETGLILDAVSRTTPTIVIAVPPLFERILTGAEERGISLQGIRASISGAMPLDGKLIDRWEEATGGLLIEGYGLSETSPIVTGNPVNTSRKAGSIGIPFPDTELRLVDPDDPDRDVPLGEPGEILVRGPQVFAGYYGLPEETDKAFHDGWFRTGDIACADEDGFLRIVDRIKEVVITGGFNVYPSEVENAMRGHDGIQDIAVIGLANDLGVEEVVAAITTPNGMKPELEELRRAAKQRLAAYKVPRRVFVISELPRNEMGKVLRREVRNLVDSMDLRERLAARDDQLRDAGSDLRARFTEFAPQLSERLDTLAPEMRERLESYDADVRAWIDELVPDLKERIDRLDIGARLELLRDYLTGTKAEDESAPEDSKD